MPTAHDEFVEWWEAQSKAELAAMTQEQLIALLMARAGAELDRNSVELWLPEERNREWDVQKPRKRAKWQWALAEYFREDLPRGRFKELARLIDGMPTAHSQEPVKLCQGKYEVHLDHDENIVCSYTVGPNKTVEQSVKRSTFEQNYLRKVPKR